MPAIVTTTDEKAKVEAKEQLAVEFKAYKKKIQEEFQEKAKHAKMEKGKEKSADTSESDMARRIEELTEQHNQAKD